MFTKVPAKGGVKVIVHAAEDPVPERVHVMLADVVTIPVGVITVPVSVSDTVNVHVVDWPTNTVDDRSCGADEDPFGPGRITLPPPASSVTSAV